MPQSRSGSWGTGRSPAADRGAEGPETGVRAGAAESLGKLGDKTAVQPLIAALKDDKEVRSYAAESLGELGDKAAVQSLIPALKGSLI